MNLCTIDIKRVYTIMIGDKEIPAIDIELYNNNSHKNKITWTSYDKLDIILNNGKTKIELGRPNISITSVEGTYLT